ncbi:MAG: spore coat protein CotJB [Oscillospiraceae bacterium]|nr:spore coat protein CotJB [Oscillospiraceae bacterium]
MNKPNNHPDNDCGYKCGALPECAPLAVAFVPMQEESTPQYKPAEALARGTLFPGLDLPWKNVVNQTGAPDTPLGELQALGFVIHELGLYLDTHCDDAEALELFNKYVELYKTGEKRYVERYGPIRQMQAGGEEYTWLCAPWPWEYGGGMK